MSMEYSVLRFSMDAADTEWGHVHVTSGNNTFWRQRLNMSVLPALRPDGNILMNFALGDDITKCVAALEKQ